MVAARSQFTFNCCAAVTRHDEGGGGGGGAGAGGPGDVAELATTSTSARRRSISSTLQQRVVGMRLNHVNVLYTVDPLQSNDIGRVLRFDLAVVC